MNVVVASLHCLKPAFAVDSFPNQADLLVVWILLKDREPISLAPFISAGQQGYQCFGLRIDTNAFRTLFCDLFLFFGSVVYDFYIKT